MSEDVKTSEEPQAPDEEVKTKVKKKKSVVETSNPEEGTTEKTRKSISEAKESPDARLEAASMKGETSAPTEETRPAENVAIKPKKKRSAKKKDGTEPNMKDSEELEGSPENVKKKRSASGAPASPQSGAPSPDTSAEVCLSGQGNGTVSLLGGPK
mmetsp:Transcript_149572/g.261416  ORF Transcript_149572/g.261416 Transcript_149572/m.261416 type:complete len:156 (-) Transcript_149572:5-472(-)